MGHKAINIRRLTAHRKRIEQCAFEAERVLIVAVHSHARLEACIQVCRGRQQTAAVAMGCCVPQTLPAEPQCEWRDDGVWSPHNLWKVWTSV
jgi:hypothetical protein